MGGEAGQVFCGCCHLWAGDWGVGTVWPALVWLLSPKHTEMGPLLLQSHTLGTRWPCPTCQSLRAPTVLQEVVTLCGSPGGAVRAERARG